MLDTIMEVHFNTGTMSVSPRYFKLFRTTGGSKAVPTPESIAIGVLFLAGIVLRIRQYLTGRSLWLDEAMLALNIVNRNFLDLFKPLDYDQGAPIGFLLIEKLLNLLFGRNELVLRLFPLTVGLLSLVVFYLILKRFTHGTSLVIAFALFAFNTDLIYYSSEVKQYIVDVFVVISLLLIAAYVSENPSKKQLIVLGIAGTFALWFSHPALFVLAGVGITLFLSNLKKRELSIIRLVIGFGVFWLVNLGILYILTLGNLQNNSFMKTYWQEAFAPMPPWSNLIWYWNAFKANADSHFAVTFVPLLLLLFMLTGWVILLKQKRELASVIAWMYFFILCASSLTIYPSLARMVLFIIPVGILLIAMFLDFVIEKLHGKPAILAVFSLLAGIYLFYGMIPLTAEQFISPKYFEHIRPTMAFLTESWREGDVMYISNGGVPAFEYYAPIYRLEKIPFIAGDRDDYGNPDVMFQKLEPLKGHGRVWVLFSHVYEKGDFNEKDFIINQLKLFGSKKREFREPGTSVSLYLFDLSE